MVLCIILQTSSYYILELHGRVLNGDLFEQRFQKLIHLHLFIDCFMKISPQTSAQLQL